ncbi:glucose-1-phosphate adenylyltransferase family protein [Nigerium massiliense]|uniref:glucose-1-phosphate adenylyltransferase family protein n=1 Tax=Nigerium massiliense TaxID=1522317 RepID=UPI00058B85DD|nr:sugar phosphate nucleotidyltransferase [Nigerium massiliense]
MRIPKTLAIILAGGKGTRLGALTQRRVKPALPVAGTYRLIDVSLSNLAHSHISDVWIVEQYLPHSLNQHLAQGRPWDLDRNHGGLRLIAPFEGGPGEGFAHGNSDTLYRQRARIAEADVDLVLVLSADHLYTCNFLDVIDTHVNKNADLTIVTTTTDENASRFGVVDVDDRGAVTGFAYKPDEPDGDLVSAEIFLYSARTLLESLDAVAEEFGELTDYGKDLVPHVIAQHRVVEHRLAGYWMDMGTLQSYWAAHMQIIDGNGAVLDDPDWPIYSAQPQQLPACIEGSAAVHRSLISSGSRVHGTVEHSVVGTGSVIEDGASVTNCVLLDGVRVGAGVELTNCIVDEGAHLDRAGVRGSDDRITLIGPDGLIADRVPFDRGLALPG